MAATPAFLTIQPPSQAAATSSASQNGVCVTSFDAPTSPASTDASVRNGFFASVVGSALVRVASSVPAHHASPHVDHPSCIPHASDQLKQLQQQALLQLKLHIQTAIQNNDLLLTDLSAKQPGKHSNVKENAQSTTHKSMGEPQHKEVEADLVVTIKPEMAMETVEEAPEDSKPDPDTPAEKEVATKEILLQEGSSYPLEDISLWGVPLLHTKGDERTDVILLKFLRARDFNADEAFTMLKNTLLWRKSFGTDKLVDQEEFCTKLDNCVAYMHGHDKQGHPVCYNVYGVFQDNNLYEETFGDESKINNFLRWRVQLLEKGIRQLDFSPGAPAAFIQITDLKNEPDSSRKELRYAIKQALSLLQDNYPEFVAKKVFINVPWYFSAIYSMFSPFLTLRTKSKFVVARPGKVSETLFKLISPDNVPVQYGGLSRPTDSDFKGSDAKCTEMIVKPGAKHTIEIPVAEVGSVVVWDLIVSGWNVNCGVEYVPSAPDGYTTIIQKLQRIQPSHYSIRDSYKASNTGQIMISIDNRLSRKKKFAAYRYVIKHPKLGH